MIVTVRTMLEYIGLTTMLLASIGFLIWYIPAPHAQGTLFTMELLFFGPIFLLALLSIAFALFVMFGEYIIEFAYRVREGINKLLEIKL